MKLIYPASCPRSTFHRAIPPEISYRNSRLALGSFSVGTLHTLNREENNTRPWSSFFDYSALTSHDSTSAAPVKKHGSLFVVEPRFRGSFVFSSCVMCSHRRNSSLRSTRTISGMVICHRIGGELLPGVVGFTRHDF